MMINVTIESNGLPMFHPSASPVSAAVLIPAPCLGILLAFGSASLFSALYSDIAVCAGLGLCGDYSVCIMLFLKNVQSSKSDLGLVESLLEPVTTFLRGRTSLCIIQNSENF